MKLFDIVVLEKDLPSRGLRLGDIGIVAEVYAPDGLEVELINSSSRTQALVALKRTNIRLTIDVDILAVRSRYVT